jgi:glycosyltransferase 2 family protein
LCLAARQQICDREHGLLIEQLRRRLLLGVLLGVVVVSAIILIADASALADAFRAFDWRLTPVIIGAILFNYILRFVKWQYYLRLVEVEGLRHRDSGLIFVSGFTMVMTPGKLGELLKAYLVRNRAGTALSRMIPVVLIERITDGMATLLLIGIGVIVFPFGWPIFVGGLLAASTLLVLVQREALIARVLNRLRSTRIRARVNALESLYISSRFLLSTRPLLVAVGLGLISWFGECVAFFVILVGLGVEPSPHLLLAATFVFGVSAWAGALSFLPGGLGATEASAVALLTVTITDASMNESVAVAATLLMRFATLWFGVFLGVIALAIVSRWPTDIDSSRDTIARGEPAQ